MFWFGMLQVFIEEVVDESCFYIDYVHELIVYVCVVSGVV